MHFKLAIVAASVAAVLPPPPRLLWGPTTLSAHLLSYISDIPYAAASKGKALGR